MGRLNRLHLQRNRAQSGSSSRTTQHGGDRERTPAPTARAARRANAASGSRFGCVGTSPAGADVDLGSGPAAAGKVKKGSLDGVTLTFASYGGIFQDGQEAAAVKPFAAESGAKVLSDGPTDYTKIKAQVDAKNVTCDVTDTDTLWAKRECGKLLMPLDPKIAPDRLYPLNVDRALKKLTSVRSSLVFWDTGARSQQLLESGEVSMAMVWSGRAYAAGLELFEHGG